MKGDLKLGAYARYSTEENRHLLEAWPELGDVIFRDTYAEAEQAAIDDIIATLSRHLRHNIKGQPVRFVHHMHEESGLDPLARFGSWGWRVDAAE